MLDIQLFSTACDTPPYGTSQVTGSHVKEPKSRQAGYRAKIIEREVIIAHQTLPGPKKPAGKLLHAKAMSKKARQASKKGLVLQAAVEFA